MFRIMRTLRCSNRLCHSTEIWCKLVQCGTVLNLERYKKAVVLQWDWSIGQFLSSFFALESLWNVAAKPRIGRLAGTVTHSLPHTQRKIIKVLPAHAAAARFGNASPLSETLWSPAHHLRACSSLGVPPPAVCLPALPNLTQTCGRTNERPWNTERSSCTIFPFSLQQVCKYLKS